MIIFLLCAVSFWLGCLYRGLRERPAREDAAQLHYEAKRTARLPAPVDVPSEVARPVERFTAYQGHAPTLEIPLPMGWLSLMKKRND